MARAAGHPVPVMDSGARPETATGHGTEKVETTVETKVKSAPRHAANAAGTGAHAHATGTVRHAGP